MEGNRKIAIINSPDKRKTVKLLTSKNDCVGYYNYLLSGVVDDGHACRSHYKMHHCAPFGCPK